MRVLSRRELTVALLARQLLLDRARMPVEAAVRHLVALQGQYSPSPYIALAARLDGFRIEDLEAALRAGSVVKSSLMRGTLHLCAAADYPAYATACMRDMRMAMRAQNREAAPYEEKIVAGVTEYLAEPRTTDEIRERVRELSGGTVKEHRLLDYARFLVPAVHVPPSGLWDRHGKFSLVAWSGPPLPPEPEAMRVLTERYLAAYGPATRDDIATFAGVRLGAVDAALKELEPARYTDADGRDLYDLPGAPLPPEDTATPVRLLARLDSATLAHRDRTRILRPEHQERLMDMARAKVAPYLVDGLVAGMWTYTAGRESATLTVIPFTGPPPAGLEPEAERMLAFVAPAARVREITVQEQ
ncbi:hypothetical protein HNP84_000558 [Thermocatellispora tengchongensis]|uniref:Winged helix DNA-binding domain-containing protein n=1 Tax=Thermocatellispora tengchongensis TaxID=1073253 RepID=A0A840P0A4_9ACTN|nr:winged helix DNA-binding domain-containing protein [Thermocatellispora tengchongensis]MBB5130870.1 hypothetical protein [Thermocatellispora tengchongensis]